MPRASDRFQVPSPTNWVKAKTIVRLYPRSSRTEPRTGRDHDNPNALNILPVTTLRTIDLGGKKKYDPLFSIFCEEASVFLEGAQAIMGEISPSVSPLEGIFYVGISKILPLFS
jgi:hypothetical protein